MKRILVLFMPRAVAGLLTLAAAIWLPPAHAQPVDSGPMIVSGSLLVMGPVTVDGSVTVSGNVHVRGPLTAAWLAQVPPAQAYRGKKVIRGPLTVHGSLVVQGDLEVRGPLTSDGPVGAVGSIDAEGPIVERR
ncbi:hypothetical protein [Variovorax sp. Sphag1AA]|uniref:hypothetical protein n=1 Tax=Variovorax sp. Sphag1AA TaxID=2587027 RepID=UPI0017B46DCD|nr:hypothetical protein [Variovorax sp. Sphag1AA]MBB3181784.1 cytoskeletal protein CcmA (bactofilin family) [Variovorax sp. Sphag1AA]